MEDSGPKPRKKRRWKGELAKPIRPKVIRPRGLAITDAKTVARANEEMEDLYRQAIEEKRAEKLCLLMDHYGIADKADFFSLALALAIDHHPGFGLIQRHSD
jgi:cytochrome P450